MRNKEVKIKTTSANRKYQCGLCHGGIMNGEKYYSVHAAGRVNRFCRFHPKFFLRKVVKGLREKGFFSWRKDLSQYRIGQNRLPKDEKAKILQEMAGVVTAMKNSGLSFRAVEVAKRHGIDKTTVGRLIKAKGLDVPSPTWADPRSHEEICRLIKEAVSSESKKRPYSDKELMRIVGYSGSRPQFSKLRQMAGIPNSWYRRS